MSKLYQTYYDVSRFTLWADSPNEDGKRARFVMSYRDGNPRFVVYTGVTGKEGVINFPMDNPTLVGLMHMLKEIANGSGDRQVILESLTPVYENDKPTKEKKVLSTFHMGKTKEGIVYFCIIAENKPKIVFPLTCSPFHVFRNASKQVMSGDEVSKSMALGIAYTVLSITASTIINYTNEEYDEGTRKPTPITGGNKGGGGGKAAQPQFADLDDIL